jgi:hypothetical protein
VPVTDRSAVKTEKVGAWSVLGFEFPGVEDGKSATAQPQCAWLAVCAVSVDGFFRFVLTALCCSFHVFLQ